MFCRALEVGQPLSRRRELEETHHFVRELCGRVQWLAEIAEDD